MARGLACPVNQRRDGFLLQLLPPAENPDAIQNLAGQSPGHHHTEGNAALPAPDQETNQRGNTQAVYTGNTAQAQHDWTAGISQGRAESGQEMFFLLRTVPQAKIAFDADEKELGAPLKFDIHGAAPW